jgi:hypothetical protein
VVTETTTRGWGQKIGDSIKGVLIGILLFIASFVVLWMNEGRIDISEVIAGDAVDISATEVDTVNEWKLVSVTGALSSTERLGDPTFLNLGDYLVLNRTVEMWAWKEISQTETEKKAGGSEETKTTYTYTTEWTSMPADSSSFHDNSPQHQNPPMKYKSETFYVNTAKVGVYPVEIRNMSLPGGKAVTLESSSLVYGKGTGAKLDGGYIFVPATPYSYYGSSSSVASPKVGDLRVKYTALPNNIDVTAFGKLDGGKLVPYTATKKLKRDAKIYHARAGSKEEAIAALHGEHTTTGWILRIVGFLLMWFGLGLLFGPITAILDVLPFLGNISKTLISIVTFFMALVLTITTIIVAMIAHSVVGLIVTVVIVLAIMTLIVMLILKRKDKKAAAAA